MVELVLPPYPPVVHVGLVGGGGHVGGAGAAPAPQPPLFLADEPEVPRRTQRLVKGQELCFLGLAGLVAGTKPVIPPLPPAVATSMTGDSPLGRASPW